MENMNSGWRTVVVNNSIIESQIGLKNITWKPLDSTERKKMTASAISFVHKKSRCLKAKLYEEESSLM